MRRRWLYRLMPSVLLAGVIASAPKNLNPSSGKPPLMSFLLRPDGGGWQLWKICALDERELGCERLQAGDCVAVVGALDVGVEEDHTGARRIAYRVTAHQILFLRNRSVAKKAAEAHSLAG
jgi:hypothetical protein